MNEKITDTTNDVVAAVRVTPMVKGAIIADKMLNDPKNHINVESISGVVTLNGHVTSEELKNHAESITKRVIVDNKFSESVSNMLVVTPH